MIRIWACIKVSTKYVKHGDIVDKASWIFTLTFLMKTRNNHKPDQSIDSNIKVCARILKNLRYLLPLNDCKSTSSRIVLFIRKIIIFPQVSFITCSLDTRLSRPTSNELMPWQLSFYYESAYESNSRININIRWMNVYNKKVFAPFEANETTAVQNCFLMKYRAVIIAFWIVDSSDNERANKILSCYHLYIHIQCWTK